MVNNIKSARSTHVKELDRFWGSKAKGLLKSKMALNNINAIELAQLLTKAGRPSKPQGVRNMISEGNFKASWYLHVMHLLEQLKQDAL